VVRTFSLALKIRGEEESIPLLLAVSISAASVQDRDVADDTVVFEGKIPFIEHALRR
jgi:hypothetical protein